MGNWSNDYYRRRLSGRELRLYDAIRAGWARMDTDVQLPCAPRNVEELSRLSSQIIMDCPELFWVNYYKSVLYTRGDTYTLHTESFFSCAEIARLQQGLRGWRRRIAGHVPTALSREDRLWLLYDYLARQVTYDLQEKAYTQTILGPYSPGRHLSSCEGIAKSFKYLCDACQLPCLVVFGSAGTDEKGAHAWNLVETSQGYRHVDVTWELQQAHRSGKAGPGNFLLRDKDMSLYQWDHRQLPVCQ